MEPARVLPATIQVFPAFPLLLRAKWLMLASFPDFIDSQIQSARPHQAPHLLHAALSRRRAMYDFPFCFVDWNVQDFLARVGSVTSRVRGVFVRCCCSETARRARVERCAEEAAHGAVLRVLAALGVDFVLLVTTTLLWIAGGVFGQGHCRWQRCQACSQGQCSRNCVRVFPNRLLISVLLTHQCFVAGLSNRCG
jgi:hypothetical protein